MKLLHPFGFFKRSLKYGRKERKKTKTNRFFNFPFVDDIKKTSVYSSPKVCRPLPSNNPFNYFFYISYL